MKFFKGLLNATYIIASVQTLHVTELNEIILFVKSNHIDHEEIVITSDLQIN